MNPPTPPTNDRIRDVLKDHGLRYSRPRELILGFLLERDKHVSAEGLYLQLKQRGVDLSLSTVYLNLSVLAEAGLLREFKGANGQSLYDSNVSPHYHVVCRETGEILDVPTPMIEGKPLARFLKETIEAATGWIVDEPRLSLSGVSPAARGARRGPGERARTERAVRGPDAREGATHEHGQPNRGARDVGATAPAYDEAVRGDATAGSDVAGSDTAPTDAVRAKQYDDDDRAPGRGASHHDPA